MTIRNSYGSFLFLVYLVIVCVGGGCFKQQSDEESILSTLSKFNLSYEAKDIDRWASFYSEQFIERLDKYKQGAIEEWKSKVQRSAFSPWKKIILTSNVESIEKTGYNYVLTEEINISGIDWEGREHNIKKDAKRILTFTKEHGNWKIAEMREISLPHVYDNLNSKYTNVGDLGLAYVCHITHSFVSVIDTKTNKLIGKIPSGYGTSWIAFASDSTKSYITNFHSNNVVVFNKKTNEKMATVPAGHHPVCVVITPDEQFALISHQSHDGIWIMNTRTNQVVKKLSGGGSLYLFKNGERIYQPEIFEPFVIVINQENQSIIKRIHVGGRPMHLAFTPDWKYAYVTNFDLNELEIIDTRSDSVVRRIPNINDPRGIAITPDGKFAYVTNVVSNTVTVVDLDNDSILKSIVVGKMPTYVAITNDGKYAYIANQGSASVSASITMHIWCQ